MAKTASKFGFVECADLVSEQKYGAALRQFQQSVGKFLDSKSPPKRGEIARQLFQSHFRIRIGTEAAKSAGAVDQNAQAVAKTAVVFHNGYFDGHRETKYSISAREASVQNREPLFS